MGKSKSSEDAGLALYGREKSAVKPRGRLTDAEFHEILATLKRGRPHLSTVHEFLLRNLLDEVVTSFGWPVPSMITKEHKAALRAFKKKLQGVRADLDRGKDEPSPIRQALQRAQYLKEGGNPNQSELVTSLIGRSFVVDQLAQLIDQAVPIVEWAITDVDKINRPRRQKSQELDKLMVRFAMVYSAFRGAPTTVGPRGSFIRFIAACFKVMGVSYSQREPTALVKRWTRLFPDWVAQLT